jgi:non-ribosomal peptide synthetase component F
VARSIELGPALSDRVRELGGRHGATPFVTLLAGFRALLAFARGARDACIGTLVANRARRETEALVGPLFNTVVLRNPVTEGTTFAGLLRREQEVLLEAQDHQELPFEAVVEAVTAERGAADRDPRRTPLHQILFASQHGSWDRWELGGVIAEPLHGRVRTPFRGLIRTARHDLAVHVVDEAGQLTLHLSGDADLFDGGAGLELLGHYDALLACMVEDPERLVLGFPGSSSEV